jgi:hypothetical protein
MTTNNWQGQMDDIVQQGRQMSAGFVNGGEMLIEADPEKGALRIKLRGIQPAEVRPQLVQTACWVLSNVASMFNLQVKQYTQETGGKQQ